MAETDDTRIPAWLREIRNTLGVSSQFILAGNVRDEVISASPGDDHPAIVPGVIETLVPWLRQDGYTVILRVDPVGSGQHLSLVTTGLGPEEVAAAHEQAARLLQSMPSDPESAESGSILRVGAGLEAGLQISNDTLAGLIRGVALANQPLAAGGDDDGRVSCCLFCSEASRLIRDPRNLEPEEHSLFVSAQRTALTADARTLSESREVALFNPVFWLVENERSLPTWFLDTGERVRIVAVPEPSRSDRRQAARQYALSFGDYREANEKDRLEMVEAFASHAHGMNLLGMGAAVRIGLDQGLGMKRIEDAVRAHRVGVTDNPWREPELVDKIRKESRALSTDQAPDVAAGEGDEYRPQIRRRVLGQEAAVRKSLDILIRSVTGMTDAHGSPSATKPRGVLFFGGPTGVGKTELAKSMAELVFGTDQALIRFDMSEFSAEHTAARLIGAPPGYVGFDAGGELTNAIRERPFSVVLFDEVEKADGRILDKFLQILDDGRLTDGRGNTVFFTEAIIVFTSNLGVIEEVTDPQTRKVTRRMRVQPGESPDVVETEIRQGIKDYFEGTLGRPELLNRIGENIVTFGFIDHDTGIRILNLLYDNVKDRVRTEHGLELKLSDRAWSQLQHFTLENEIRQGGRGIGSRLEQALTNPLSRLIFERQFQPGTTVTIGSVTRQDGMFHLGLEG